MGVRRKDVQSGGPRPSATRRKNGAGTHHAQEVLGLLQQLAGEHDDKVGAVADLVLLLLRRQDEHLGGGVLDLGEGATGAASDTGQQDAARVKG